MDAWWFQTLFCLGCFNTYLAVSWHRYFVDHFPTETHRFSCTFIYCLKLINFHQSPVTPSSLVRCMLWINKVGRCVLHGGNGHLVLLNSDKLKSFDHRACSHMAMAYPQPRNPRTGDSLGLIRHGSRYSTWVTQLLWKVRSSMVCTPPISPEEMGWSIHQAPPKASQFGRYISFPTVGKHRPEKRQSPCQVPADCCWPWREVRRRRG